MIKYLILYFDFIQGIEDMQSIRIQEIFFFVK